MATYQQHMKALQRAQAAGDAEAVEYIRGEAVKAMQSEDKARFKADEAARPLAQRVITNLGAGLDSAWQGAKQLVGQGAGDEAIKEKRQRDAELAEGTTGGGLIQIAGELAPAVALGGGVGVAARALPSAVQASRGMQLANRAMSAAPARGAAEGALAGALMPTLEDESRLGNMALAGAGGAAAPYVLKGAMAAGRGVKHGAQRVAAGVSENAAKAAAGRDLTKQLTREGIDSASIGPTKYQPHPFVQTKPSAAVATQNPKLADLELASRNASRAEWMPFDQGNQVARWKALDENLAGTADVDTLLAQANKIGGDVPYQAVGPKKFLKEMDSFYSNLQAAKQTPQYHGKPAVRAAVDYIENTMREAGQVTPELLHQIRQTVSRGLTGVPGAGEAGVRAASSEPFVISLSQAMDNVLEKASKGKWGKWKADYGDVMTKADSAKADVNIRNMFVDEATGVVRKPVAGLDDDVPQVTAHALKQAMTKAGSAKRGPRKGQNLLSTASQDVMEGVTKDLDAAAILQRAKASSTGGSGSDTAPNLVRALAIETMVPGAGLAKLLQETGRRNISEAQRKALAELLQDPAKLRAFLVQQELRKAAQSRLSTNPLLRGAGVAATLPGMD